MTASESQSTRISLTFCTLPDSSPFIHSLFLDLLQNHELPVFWVSSSDSLLEYASVRTSLVLASWAITGTSPSPFAKSMSEIFIFNPPSLDPYRYAVFFKVFLYPVHGMGLVVKN